MVSVLDSETETLPADYAVHEIREVAASELEAALVWTRRAAESQLDFATTLVSDYPQLWRALHAGVIDLPKARVITGQTLHLEPDIRDQVVDQVLERAPDQTTGQLAARIRRLAISVDPESAKRRYETGLEERKLTSEANNDGTDNLFGWHLPPGQTRAIMKRINRYALQLKTLGDGRTMDQIRADVFLDLLHGKDLAEGRHRAVVDISVDLTTLTGLSENPGEIPGWGPVISDIARQIVTEQPEAEWRYTITGENGQVISNGTTRRRPTTTQKRRVQTLANTCVFPGCRMPATDCDIDHNHAHAQGGPTSDHNLGPFCRHHHVIKHRGWTIIQTHPGIYQLTSPLGHTYTSQPRAP